MPGAYNLSDSDKNVLNDYTGISRKIERIPGTMPGAESQGQPVSSGPGVGGPLGITNDMNQGMMPQLQSIIDKVAGSFSGVSRGRVAMLQAGLGEKAMGIMGGLKQEEMQQGGALEREKIGIQKTAMATEPAMMEAKLNQTLFPKGTIIGKGIGGKTDEPDKNKPLSWKELWEARKG